MFDAYKVAVKISLKDDFSQGMNGLSIKFNELNKSALLFQTRLEKIKKIMMFGAVIGGSGIFGLSVMSKTIKVASEYAHQLNIMNMAGIKHVELVKDINSAWKNTSVNLTSTATGNLKALLDLRNIFGNSAMARQYMPELTKIQTVLGSSSESSISSSSDTLVYALAKALDIRGAVNNPNEFNVQAQMMAKVITATQGRVLPQDYQMLFKYGRQSIPSLSNNFLYNELPTFMLQMKTGGAGSGGQGGMGTSLAAFYRFFVQGVMTKGALQSMQEIGLINKGAGLHTTTTGTQLMSGQHVKGLGLAQSDPFLWVQNYMLPAIRKKYGNDLSNQQTTYAIGQAMKGASQTGIFAVQQFAIKAQQVYRDEAIIQRAKDVNQAYSMALSNDPNTAMSALSAQWKNTETAFAMTVIPILIPALISLTRNLNDLSITMRKFPKITSEVAKGLFYLFTAMTGVGAVTIVGSIFAKFFLMFKPLRIILLALIFPITEIVIAMGVMGAGLFKLLSYLNGFIALFTTHKGFIRDVEAFNSAIGRQDLNEKYQKGLIIPNKSSDTVIHSHLYLNGDEIAKSVTKSQAKKMTNQPNHGSVINGSMFLSPNMANAYAIGHQS